MKYGIRACTEQDSKGKALSNSIGNDRVTFDTKVDAIMYAEKVRNGASIGVYFKIDEIDE